MENSIQSQGSRRALAAAEGRKPQAALASDACERSAASAGYARALSSDSPFVQPIDVRRDSIGVGEKRREIDPGTIQCELECQTGIRRYNPLCERGRLPGFVWCPVDSEHAALHGNSRREMRRKKRHYIVFGRPLLRVRINHVGARNAVQGCVGLHAID